MGRAIFADRGGAPAAASSNGHASGESVSPLARTRANVSSGGGPRAVLSRRSPLARRSRLRVVALLSLAAALALVPAAPAQDASLPLGTAAPRSIPVETLDGKPLDLGAYVGRTPLVLEFWATWCPLCKALDPTLRAAHARYGREARFVVVAVSVNQSPARVKAHAAEHRMPYEIVFDRKGAASSAFEVFATSTVVVLDRAGKVVYTGQGGDQDIAAAVAKALR